ncbi:hypothetical protein HC362_34520 [Streptomyces sp. 891-h]|nr:hypothetical protein HC362_34520 [Streptomyces sp. 891-h]
MSDLGNGSGCAQLVRQAPGSRGEGALRGTAVVQDYDTVRIAWASASDL